MLPCRRPDPRAALVTGASSGIGAAVARALPPSTAIDLLVNNAGLGTFGPFLEEAPPKLEATLEVNVLAVATLCRALLPGMLARARAAGRRAGLVNVASTAGFAPVPQLASYAASKAFVLSLTEALTAELARAPIDILAFCPGPVRTPFGSRAGWRGSALPGAISPDAAARRLLAALGHRRTAFTDLPSEALLAPVAQARRCAAAALAAALGLAGKIDGFRHPAG